MDTYTFSVKPTEKTSMDKEKSMVIEYNRYKSELSKEIQTKDFKLYSELDIEFYFKMPDTWDTLKKEEYRGTPCKNYDLSKLLQAFLGVVYESTESDKILHSIKAKKFWSDKYFILVYQPSN